MSEKENKLLDYFKGDELAASVWKGKYAQEGEETPSDMHWRLAKEFARVEDKYQENEYLDEGVWIRDCLPLSDYGQKRDALNEESIYELFKDFKHIVPQGSIMSQLGSGSIGSLSNCCVIGQPEDSYGGIFQKDEEMAQLMKRRGGVGLDISTLRPEGTTTSNAAKTSTGAVSFMKRFSSTTREVAQQGRRGALMISMDVNHPDIMEFIKIKRDLSQVTGANISIKLNDEFMKAVENDEGYVLRFPCAHDVDEKKLLSNMKANSHPYDKLLQWSGNLYFKKIKAKEYWDEIIKSAHGVAEPGLMYWDRMVDYSPDGVYPQFRQVTTNPCSEIAMQEYDACRLIAVNLLSFVDNPFTEEASFNYEKFYEVNYEAMRLSDDLIDLEIEHIDRIIDKIQKDTESWEVKQREAELWIKVRSTALASRRTGLGFTALGDTLAALNVRYGSEESLDHIEAIMKIKMASEWDCTIDLGILRGTFEGYDKDLEEGEGNSFYEFLYTNFPDQYNRMREHGRRNVSVSTVAPTGSLSMLTQTTSGVEPLFKGFYTRRKKVNPGEGVKVDSTDDNGDTWQEFAVLHPQFKEWCNKQEDILYNIRAENPDVTVEELDKDELSYMFEISPWYKATANDIPWKMRVKTQALIQKYISHSISSTVNLPEDVSLEEVSNIYKEAWKQGVKGITVYREGSRSGVLVDSNKKNTTFEYRDAPKRPKVLPCKVHQSTSNGLDFLITVSLMEGKPYEVFCTKNIFKLPQNVLEADLIKVKRGRYDLDIKDELYLDDISFGMTDEQEVLTRMVSTSLRHGADIRFITEQLSKTNGELFSFAKSLARVLKKYIPEGSKSTVSCTECGSDNVVFEEGCSKCLDCGYSACN